MAKIPDASSLGERRIPVGRSVAYQDDSAEIMAGAIGNAARQIGGAVTQFADHRDEFRVAKAGAEFSKLESAARNFEDNDWETYEDRYRKTLTQAKEGILKNIKLPRNREVLSLELDSAIERGAGAVKGVARAKEVEFGRADLSSTLDAFRTSALSVGDEESRTANIKGAQMAIRSAMDNRYIDPTDAQRINKEFTQSYAEGFIDTQPLGKQIEVLQKPEGTPANLLPPDRRANLLKSALNEQRILQDRAEAEAKSKQAELRVALSERVRDASASYRMGLQYDDPPSKTEFMLALGPEKGEKAFAELQKDQDLAVELNSLSRLPPAEQRAALAKLEPGATAAGDILDEVYAEYPGLSKYGFQFRDSLGKGGSRKLEFYPPGESHSPFEDNSKPGIERFDPSMGKQDIFGEMLHFLPHADKKAGALRREFQDSITPEQKDQWLRGDYESQIKNGLFGKNPPSFDQWLGRQGGDAFFRGYLTKQYPEKAYTGAQIELFSKLDAYLRQAPLTATAGVAEQAERYSIIRQRADALNRAKASDPASYVATYSPSIQRAYDAYAESSDDPAVAQQYAQASIAEQARLGVANPQILPKAQAESIAQSFYMKPEEGEKLAALIQSEREKWGRYWPKVAGQLMQAGMPSAAIAIARGMDPGAATRLAGVSSVPIDEMKKGVDKPPGDITTELESNMSDFRKSLDGVVGGENTFSAMYDAAERLSYLYLRQGKGTKEATQQAYDEVLGNHYAFGEVSGRKFRVPVDRDIDSIEDGARLALGKASDLKAPIALGSLSSEEAASDLQRVIAKRGYWVTSANGERGLALFLDGAPVLRTDGSVYELTWDELANVSEEQRQEANRKAQQNPSSPRLR